MKYLTTENIFPLLIFPLQNAVLCEVYDWNLWTEYVKEIHVRNLCIFIHV